MKKRILLEILSLCLLAGCQRTAPSFAAEDNSPVLANGPGWTVPAEEYIETVENLNLDGVGDYDDSIYASYYKWGDSGDGITVIQIKLGSGKHLAKVFMGIYSPFIQTDYLIFEERQSVIVELVDPASTYTPAVTLSVFSVDKTGSYLETYLSIDNIQNEASLNFSMPLTLGTEIIPTDQIKEPGLLLQVINDEDREHNLEKVAQWTGEGWVITDQS